jgi:hypothetical protein
LKIAPALEVAGLKSNVRQLEGVAVYCPASFVLLVSLGARIDLVIKGLDWLNGTLGLL